MNQLVVSPGRPDRLGQVDRQFHHPLRRFAVSLVGDPGRAEEIVQDTLLRLWQRQTVLNQPASNLRAWLFTVARNLAYDELRRARRRREFATDTQLDRPVDDPCAQIADTLVIRRALATLSLRHREVIVHAYYRRATTEAIAADLAIAPGTVKSRLHYALRELRQACIAQGVTRDS
ncbi:sigma-70 family RNA polymerase sigma factor [Nocardia alni]|uniref:sigma-70 family RNA polymerase sigma factor n=1 Tax=Nocardia alni TaxID=2815723 RepID=UPI001C2207A3|nr:sigma-70 family RNA polymerase sigma factor [Nocardia alni]